MIFLIFVPFLTAIVYLIVRGPGCTSARPTRCSRPGPARMSTSGPSPPASPADQIAQAKRLLDSGAISQAEFDALKAKALS